MVLQQKPTDLILIDIYSREFDGVSLVRQLCEQGVVFVLLLTAINMKSISGSLPGMDECVVNIKPWLRRKVDPDPGSPRYIHTEAGLGYKFQDTQI
jgi:DNA-binding response OmpR family regulator